MKNKLIMVGMVFSWVVAWIFLIHYFWTDPIRKGCDICLTDSKAPQCHMSYCSEYLNGSSGYQ